MYVHIKVFPGAPKESVEEDKKRLRVFLKEEAKDNQANDRARVIIAGYFHTEVSKVRIVSGHKYQNKLLEIIQN